MKSPVALLREHGLRPKKRLGQNFLVDTGISARIAEAASSPTSGTTVEIGPGLGALTRPLLERAARVVAIERDPELAAILRIELADPIAEGRLVLHEDDALALDWASLFGDRPRPHILAGNVPYLITGALIERAVQLASRIDRAVFMVQAEVAARLIAKPATDDYGGLSVFVQSAFEPSRLLGAKAGAFFPRPEIDSAVVVLTPRPTPVSVEDDAFRTVVKSAFGARRKTLRNAWRGAFGWSPERLDEEARAIGVDLGRRGETLSTEEFAAMAARGRAG